MRVMLGAHTCVCICACVCLRSRPVGAKKNASSLHWVFGPAIEARQHLCHSFIVVGVSHTPAPKRLCHYVYVCVCMRARK